MNLLLTHQLTQLLRIGLTSARFAEYIFEFKSRFVLGFSHEYIAVFNVHILLIIKDHLKTSSHSGDTPLILFDYHVLCKGGKKDKLEMLKKKAQPYLNKFKVFVRKGDDIVRYFSRIIYLF